MHPNKTPTMKVELVLHSAASSRDSFQDDFKSVKWQTISIVTQIQEIENFWNRNFRQYNNDKS